MGALFSKKKKYWVPDHRKLEDLCDDPQRWKPVVDMTGWQIQNSLGEKLTTEMIEAKGTVEVNLSFNGLGDDECDMLAKVIKQSKVIKRLVLENNHIHAKGAESLAHGAAPGAVCAVSDRAPPTPLRAGRHAACIPGRRTAMPPWCEPPPPCALNPACVLSALTPETGKDDPPLEVLNLRNNNIGDEGATKIAQVLTCNKTLKKVDLYWNNIGNKGLEAICNNLRPDFPKDFVLDIRYNGYDTSDPAIEWKDVRKKLNASNIQINADVPGPVLLGFPEDLL
eukprot:Tamp_20952.p1 GENE.Tamp_20952~~Tamp_20952.p1  ORF type:complete len:281 (-),score=71.96 Tamp_20952:187-1029(-)